MAIKAIIFDLDGVIVSTDEQHYLGWQRLADEIGRPFDRVFNEKLRGVSRMEALDMILGENAGKLSSQEKEALAARKNGYYRDLLEALSPEDILPGVMQILEECQQRGIRVAIGSSSKNAPTVLERIGLADAFEVVADGNAVSRSKPDPEVFLLAAQRLGVPARECLVVEDAEAGVTAALAAGMRCLAVGSAAADPRAHFGAPSLREIRLSGLLG